MFNPQNGIATMFKTMLENMGVDATKLEADVSAFMNGMREHAATIKAGQERLEAQGAAIMAELERLGLKLDEVLPIQTTREIYEDGKATGVLITSERFPEAMLAEAGLGGGVSNGGA